MAEWDDDEKYYKVQIGEILNKQYQVTAKCGKGVFSTVVKAIDLTKKEEVAIKVNFEIKINKYIL